MNKKRFLKIYIEITNICNLNCSFCSKTQRTKKYMTAQEFEEICKEIKEYTNIIALHVQGEPLLHPELGEILEICNKYNLKVNITTNATLIDKQMNVIVKSKAIRQINFSLHSAEQNNIDKKLYIEKVLEAVNEIHNKTNIIISYRLWNLENIKENSVNIEILNLLGKHYNIENIVDIAKKNNFIELDKNIFLNQDLEFEWPNINREKISDSGKCYGLRNQIAILVNGNVVPCCLDAEGNIVLGNVFEKSLEEIINSNRSKAIIEGFQKGKLIEELCQKCGYIKKFNNI